MKKRETYLFLLITLCIGICIYLFYFTIYFEREKPEIIIGDIDYWNLKWDIPLTIKDNNALKRLTISLENIRVDNIFNTAEPKEIILIDKILHHEKELNLHLPKPKFNPKNNEILTYKIQLTDNSFNHFFKGNKTTKELNIKVDFIPPQIKIIAISNTITRGGTALVIFKANDESIANIAISNAKDSFLAFPFIKQDYFIGIIPWSILNDMFNASIIVKDKAGNTKKSIIGYAKYARNYRTSNINLKHNFIDNHITELINSLGEKSASEFNNKADLFKYINEYMRHKNDQEILEAIRNIDVYPNLIYMNAFKPTTNAAIVGLFGDHRKFFLDKKFISESRHQGIDLASTKHAPIYSSNEGKVVFADNLGIYGNTILIEHGFGISSLYSHLSEINVRLNDWVSTGEIIGRTGNTGLSLGDHLHFGILIQGVPVLSNEWMDSRWLKVNVNNVINNAKEIIEHAKD